MNVNVNKECDGEVPVICAIRSGSVRSLEELARMGADLRNPLFMYLAIGTNSTPIIEALVRCGFDIDTTDENGYSPLHAAVITSKTQSIATLINLGASVNKTNRE